MTLPSLSLEFFPPKTDELTRALWRAAVELAPLRPSFVSVTYGAGGSTRDRTHDLVVRLQRELKLRTAAHLTCVGATRAEVDAIAARYWRDGIEHIVALRGDPPEMNGAYQPHKGGYAYARDLVEGLRKVALFEISVAAYPEIHPEAVNAEVDLENLKRKYETGAQRAMTQFFFDTEIFARFLDRAAKAGIAMPIVPGILPIANFARARDFAARCGASVPEALAARFDGVAADSDEHRKIALDVAIEHCQALRKLGVDHFHFYTLNRSDMVLAIARALGYEDRHAASA